MIKSASLGIQADSGIGRATGSALNGGANLGQDFFAPAAYVGPGSAPAPGFRGPLAPDYIRSDSVFGGAFASLAPGSVVDNANNSLVLPYGGYGNTFADFSVSTPGLQGFAGGTLNTTSSATVRLDFVANTSFTGQFSFDLRSLISLSGSGSLDPAYATSGVNSLIVTLSSVGDSFAFGTANAPFVQKLSLVGDGNVSFDSGVVSVNSGNIDFVEGRQYSLSILQNSSVSIAAVPEPSSVAVFGLLGVGALVAVRRARKN